MVRLVPRIRFSLRTFFVTLIVLSLIGSNQYTAWKWRLAQKEIQRLRDEMGVLTIDDPTRFYVRELPTMEPLTWQWRIYAPPGERNFCVASSRIAQTGTQAGAASGRGTQRPTDPLHGEYTLTARIERDQAGNWRIATSFPEGRMGMNIMPPDAGWLGGGENYSMIHSLRKLEVKVSGAKRKTESFSADEPVVLLRLRAPTAEQAASHEPCDGVMIWFDQSGSVPGMPNVRQNSATGTSASR